MTVEDAGDGFASTEILSSHSPSPWRMRIILVMLICAVATLGVLLYQSSERERQLRNNLDSVSDERDEFAFRLNNVQRQLARSEESLAEIRDTLNDTEKALGAIKIEGVSLSARVQDLLDRYETSERDRLLAKSEAARFSRALRDLSEKSTQQLAESQNQFEECVKAARHLRSKLDDVASEIKSGTQFLTSIPSEWLVSSYGSDIVSEYERTLKKYNDLVDRFNASIQRCNELQDTVNAVIRVLGR